ncbi:MAG: FkbM family methyltransferase [Chloroflexota bacterium]
MLQRRLFPHGVLRIPIDDSHSFVMRSRGDYIETDLHRWGYGRGWEGLSLQVWSRLAREAGTVLDIGAFRGVYALAAKAMNPAARVIAFEPVEVTHRRLVENAELNGMDIDARRLAVSDNTGTAVMFDSVGRAHALASLARPPKVAYLEVEVPTTTLDDYLEREVIASIDLIKIDVEGHEAAVLRGMTGLLARSTPTMIIELLTEGAGAPVVDMLHRRGYEAYLISENDGLEQIASIGAKVRGSRNFLFCQPAAFESARLPELLIGA